VPGWLGSGRIETHRLVGRLPFAASLLGVAGAILWVSSRLPRRNSTRSLAAIACGAGLVFTLGFNSLAPGLLSFEEEGRLASSVPGAALVQYGVWRPSALYYFGHVDRFAFIPIPPRREMPSPQMDPGWEALIARLRSDEPVFCMSKERYAEELMEASGAMLVSQRAKVVLLANRAAQHALAERRKRNPS
jgi:hypothetical protein